MIKKHDEGLEYISKAFDTSCRFIIGCVWAIILGFLIVGAGCSVLLLIKLFPAQALIIFKALVIPFTIIFWLLKITLVMCLVFILVYFIIKFNNKKYEEEHNARRTRNHNTKITK
jgi:heme/copper-type cytochrome/quinol oxidase subunit 2